MLSFERTLRFLAFTLVGPLLKVCDSMSSPFLTVFERELDTRVVQDSAAFFIKYKLQRVLPVCEVSFYGVKYF